MASVTDDEKKDYWDVDEQFCGWMINHKPHIGLDIPGHNPLFKCPGYVAEIGVSLNDR
ncbi:hypothetical protein PP914_gp138 [Arthrobacter phage Qui]|uniref:Uncharacterized protein n=1 Tax=Arthrobacter phage Qui TaxID=2603260 RepID=A0A5B8WIN3_9CAUD|nr:hypothetical protein PP914_gp138 [Arthrobacter phage Qui]QED11627.1 hypothetical protein SEA_QUI_138 [Arthrobacter phage Qui]QOC56459.1 hypothetical protein SEA_PAELLA_138 [Arthrobacter phage Paella]